MNKKNIIRIGSAALIAIVSVAGTFHVANASGVANFLGIITSPVESLNLVLAWFINEGLTIMSWLLAIAGSLLNFSINLTLNIKAFVDNSPAIFNTWKAIRDISGIFIIFFLLYAAMQLILGIEDPKFKALIKNIVMAGILINFSFFFAGLGIDVSNIVSVQLYNAIAPANGLNANTAIRGGVASVKSTLADGGISAIFMNSLKIPTLYSESKSSSTALGSSDTAAGHFNDTGKIIFIGIVGILIEFAAAMSFAIVALAFVGRFVILIFLLAFSPIWFMGFIAPEIKTYTKKLTDTYKSMLIFMPVYLLLMYLAMNVLTTSPIFGSQNGSTVSATSGGATTMNIVDNALAAGTPNTAGGDWYSDYLAMAANAALVIFLLNMPLAAAASIAGKTLPILEKGLKNFSSGAIWSRFGSQAGSRTLGRAAYALNESRAVAKLAANVPLAGALVSSNLSKISKADFGDKKGNYEDRLKTRNKAREDLHKKIGTIDKSKFDTSTEEGRAALKEATAEAKNDQAKYRQNLPWRNAFTGKPGGVIGFMVDNRANRQSAAKLGEEAEKQKNLGEEKKIRKDKNDKEQELRDLENAIKDQEKETRVGFSVTPGKPATPEQLAKKAALKKEIDDYQDKLDKIEETKDQARIDKTAGAIADKTKAEGGGGGGGSGEKKEEKKAE